jgi:hypothetical protein
MSKYFLPLTLALALVVGFAVVPAVAGGPGSGKGGVPGELRVEGTVTAVNVAANSVTIATRAGVAVTVTASAATKIERNGVRVLLSAIKVGDRGQARYVAGGAAHKIESTGP